MSRGQNVAATLPQYITVSPHFLLHLLGAAVGQKLLHINAAMKGSRCLVGLLARYCGQHAFPAIHLTSIPKRPQ